MKNLRTLIITTSLCVIALFLFLFFRTTPVSRLWKGYQVLYVSSETLTEAQVYEIIVQQGCKHVIAKVNQAIPIVSRFSPVQVQTPDSYITKRNAFFSDEHNTVQVFYIPEGQEGAVTRAIHALSAEKNTTAGTDGTAAFPWLSPLLCFAFAVVCGIVAKHKTAFLPAAFFLLMFSFTRPLFTTSAAVCLALYGFFMVQKIWGRPGFLASAYSPLLVLCLIVPLFLLAFSSLVSALFYVLALAAAFSAVLLAGMVKSVYDEKRLQRSFKPTLIRGARLIPLVERKELKLIAGISLAVAIMLLVSLTGPTFQSVSLDATQPALPAPAVTKADLPDLRDFIDWSWQTVTFPYRRLSDAKYEAPMDGDRVVIPDFTQVNGVISESAQTAYVFNATFRNAMYDSIKELPYPALEKMLLKQGKDTRYSYARSGGTAHERWGSMVLLVFLGIPVGIIGYFVLVRRHYGVRF